MADHPIVHIEIPSTNTRASSEFYAAVFDWKIRHEPAYDFFMFDPGSGPGGGFIDTQGNWGSEIGKPILYIATDNIEATLGKIEAAGGKTTLPKTELPGIGWFAFFTDPEGNRLAVYTALPAQEP